MEMRGHEHDVEVVVFAPVAAYTAIRELAGIPVSVNRSSPFASNDLPSKVTAVSDTAYMWPVVQETRL
jgi:platelet-activating factor acetylhydrolase IB subunit alpha